MKMRWHSSTKRKSEYKIDKSGVSPHRSRSLFSCLKSMESVFLYDSHLLNDTVTNIEYPLEPWMHLRPLAIDDFDKGILNLLSQLTYVGFVTRNDFKKRFNEMKCNGNYYITVIEDNRTKTIIATSTLFTEMKLIHQCAIRGRLEDVVVNDSYRGRHLGKIIVSAVTNLSKKLGCYKMSLDCKDNLIKFYGSLGYRMEPGNSNSMVVRFDDKNETVSKL